MKDIIGQRIEVGSYVTYASTFSQLTIGRVVSFTTIKPYHAKNSGANLVTTNVFSPSWVGHTRIDMRGKVLVLNKRSIPAKMRASLDKAYERKTSNARSVPRRSVRSGRA